MQHEKRSLLKTIEPLFILEGNWEGSGTASFPSIGSFEYREESNFTTQKNEPYMQFTQKAWLIKNNSERLIHWETGIISAVTPRKLKLYTCHMNGRIEIANGSYIKSSSKYKLTFKSEFIKNNSSIKTVISSLRELIFTEKTLDYKMGMSTSDIRLLKDHLEAKLLKVA